MRTVDGGGMSISLLDSAAAARLLHLLIEKHDRISIAVAWGSMMPLAEVLVANRSKFESILIGVDFCATDPQLIDCLIDVPNAFVARNRPGCFHPKIFYFESAGRAEAIVGSANFTNGGLGRNFEACVHVGGASSDAFFVDLRDQLFRYKKLRLPITEDLAESYRRQSASARAAPRPRNPILPDDPKEWRRVNSPLAAMTWDDFANLAKADVHHDYGKRVRLLRAVRQMFARVGSFADLTTAEWKAIAGVLGDIEAEATGLKDLDWGWFGSMGGAGTFASAIGLRESRIAKALDAIPVRGEVTNRDFLGYCKVFTDVFAGAPRTARVGPATRLLAMKRPDVFVCVNGGNERSLAEALSYAFSTLTLDNYWARVIEPISQAPWYNSPRPRGRDLELWDARAAMLDAIYYLPRR